MDSVLILTAGCSDVCVEGGFDKCMFAQHTCGTLMGVSNDFTIQQCKNAHGKFSFRCIYVETTDHPHLVVMLPCASHDPPRGPGLDELSVSVIIADWSQMCCTPINGCNYQQARLRNPQIRANKCSRFWVGCQKGFRVWLRCILTHWKGQSLSAWY